MESVHPVYGMGFRIRLRERHLELGHGVHINGCLVGHDMYSDKVKELMRNHLQGNVHSPLSTYGRLQENSWHMFSRHA